MAFFEGTWNRVVGTTIRSHQNRCLPLALGLSVLVLAACDRTDIEVYQLPKKQIPKPYVVPEQWTEQPPSELRLASFTVNHGEEDLVDISFTAFPRLNVPDVDIVNLWREQVGLSRVDEAEVSSTAKTVRIGTYEGTLFDMSNPQSSDTDQTANRIVTAFLHHEDLSWFFKMTGPAAAVETQTTAFLDFLKSVNLALAKQRLTAQSHTSQSAPPPPRPRELPEWSAPTHWEQIPPTQMLLAKFNVRGDGDTLAEITISAFPGNAGGLLANVNRWATQQLGLDPINADQLPDILSDINGESAQGKLVDLTGESARIIAAIISRPEETWFVKMMGSEALVGAEKEAFTNFVQSFTF